MLKDDSAVSVSVGFILTFTITVLAMVMVMNTFFAMTDNTEQRAMAEQSEIYGNSIALQILNIDTMVNFSGKAGMSPGQIRQDLDLPDRIAGQHYSVEFSSTTTTTETEGGGGGGPAEDMWFTHDGNLTGNALWTVQENIDTIDTFTIGIVNRSSLGSSTSNYLRISAVNHSGYDTFNWYIQPREKNGNINVFWLETISGTGFQTLTDGNEITEINMIDNTLDWVDDFGVNRTESFDFYFNNFDAARTNYTLEIDNGNYGYGQYTISGYLTNGTRFTIVSGGGGGGNTTTQVDYANEMIFRSQKSGDVLTKVEFVNLTTGVESTTIYSAAGEHYLLYNPTTNIIEVY